MLSTHILSEVQATCDKIKMIEHGHMIFSGTMEEFNNYVEPCSFLVTFGNPPAPEELKNIDGISEVEPLPSGSIAYISQLRPVLHNRSLPGV